MTVIAESMGYDEVLKAAIMISRDPSYKARSRYNVWKWWGRRSPVLARLALASLLYRSGEEELLYSTMRLDREGLRESIKRTQGKVVVDPFSGGGTIVVEASRLGYNAYGFDINPGAVEVARATADVVCGACTWTRCMVDSLWEARRRSSALWMAPGGGIVIHAFLARCSGECRAPKLLSVKRRRAVILDPGSRDGVSTTSPEDLKPLTPLITLPEDLPEAAPGYRVYAVELLEDGDRRFISLLGWGEEARSLREWAAESLSKAKTMLHGTCTRIPLLKETRKLRLKGVECWEQLYTPRQLATLKTFIEVADARGCGAQARLVAANATRTCSLLALYYQPAGRVTPGLVLKTYWLPPYPVELNPVAYTMDNPPRTLARGTLASYASRAVEACGPASCPGKWRIYLGDAGSLEPYPRGAYAIVTDPPYPGMQSYTDMSLPYLYWLGEDLPSEPLNPMKGQGYLGLVERFATASTASLTEGGYIVILLNPPPGEVEAVAAMTRELYRRGAGLRRVYWLPGEAPGRLGRSGRRGVYMMVYRLGSTPSSTALTPLEWVEDLASEVGRASPDLSIDPAEESIHSARLAAALRGLLGG